MDRVCVIHNSTDSEVGFLGELLAEFKFEPTMITRESGLGRVEIDRYRFFVLMGSDWSTYWPELRNEVEREVELVRVLSSDDVPLLGICFGAQIISQACSGIVRRLPASEIGWTQVDGVSESSVTGRWMQWHHDAFTTPPGFEVVGMNTVCVQGIRRGRSLGLQFHPEANFGLVSHWISSGGYRELDSMGLDADRLLAETEALENEARQRCFSLFNWYLNDVAGAIS